MGTVLYAGKVSAWRRERSSHELARPSRENAQGAFLQRCYPNSDRRCFMRVAPTEVTRRQPSLVELLCREFERPSSASASAATEGRQYLPSLPSSRFCPVRRPLHAYARFRGYAVPSRASRHSPAKTTLPNPSLKRTANGVPPWPRGRVVYHRPRGQGATPLAAG